MPCNLQLKWCLKPWVDDLIVWKNCLVLRSLCDAFVSLIATFTLELSLWCWDGDRKGFHDSSFSFGIAVGRISEDVFVVRESYEGALFAEEEIDVSGNSRLLGLGQGLTQWVITVTSAWWMSTEWSFSSFSFFLNIPWFAPESTVTEVKSCVFFFLSFFPLTSYPWQIF